MDRFGWKKCERFGRNENIFSVAKKPTALPPGSEFPIRKQININFKQDHKYFMMDYVGKLSVNVMLTALKNLTSDVYMQTYAIWMSSLLFPANEAVIPSEFSSINKYR